DRVVPHGYVGRPEYVDGVAVLTSAAGTRCGVLNSIVCDQTAIVTLGALPNANAAITRASNAVRGDHETAIVDPDDGVGRGSNNRIAGNQPLAAFQRDAVAA